MKEQDVLELISTETMTSSGDVSLSLQYKIPQVCTTTTGLLHIKRCKWNCFLSVGAHWNRITQKHNWHEFTCYYRTFFRRLSVWNIPRSISCLWARDTSNARASRHSWHYGLGVVPHSSASLAASLWSQNWWRLPNSRQLWWWNGKCNFGLFSCMLARLWKASHLFSVDAIFLRKILHLKLYLCSSKVHSKYNMGNVSTISEHAVNSDFASKMLVILHYTRCPLHKPQLKLLLM